MNRNRIIILAVVAVVAFGGAFLVFRGGDSSTGSSKTSGADGVTAACAKSAGANASYEVRIEEQPSVDTNVLTLTVTHSGNAVTDAKVCLDAAMSGMSHDPVGGQAEKMSGGRYQVATKFPMRGRWAGSVTVAEPGKPATSVPLTFDVR